MQYPEIGKSKAAVGVLKEKEDIMSSVQVFSLSERAKKKKAILSGIYAKYRKQNPEKIRKLQSVSGSVERKNWKINRTLKRGVLWLENACWKVGVFKLRRHRVSTLYTPEALQA